MTTSLGPCPTCSSPVQVVGDPDEGTMHYEPVPQFSTDELSLIAHMADATLSLYRGLLDYPTSEQTVGQIEALQVKAASLAFMEVARDA